MIVLPDLRIATIVRLVAMRWTDNESCAYLVPDILMRFSSNSDRANREWADVRDPEVLTQLNHPA